VEKPLLLRGAADAGALATLIGGAAKKKPAGAAGAAGAADIFDLFGGGAPPQPPPPPPAAAPAAAPALDVKPARAASGGAYGDLEGLGSAGEL